MENETIINQTNLSQAPDQQELLVLENEYKVASLIDFHVENIIYELKDLTKHFFKLGFHLFKLKEAWSEELTKNEFYKYCEEKFYLKSTSIKNFINVYKSFRSKDVEDEIDERFEGFTFTALVELLPISDDKEFAKSFAQSFIHKRPFEGTRRDYGDKELLGITFDPADKPKLEMVKKRKSTLSRSARKAYKK